MPFENHKSKINLNRSIFGLFTIGLFLFTVNIFVNSLNLDLSETAFAQVKAAGTDLCTAGGEAADFILTAAETSFDNTPISIVDCTFRINGTHTFASLTLGDAAGSVGDSVLTHDPSTTSAVTRLNITTTGGVIIAYDGIIDLVEKGFLVGYTSDGAGGVTTAGAATTYSGASHGGLGGQGNDAGSPNSTYDSITSPSEPGAGSGESNGGLGVGGGYLRLLVNGDFTNNGVISADSFIRTSGHTPGAAGGIFITTVGAIAGNGAIRANGVKVQNGSRGGSGGGRVAFEYDSTASAGNSAAVNSLIFQARGGAGGFQAAAPGTVFINDTGTVGGGDLIITGTVATTQSTIIPDSSSFRNVIVSGDYLVLGQNMTINDSFILNGNPTVETQTVTIVNNLILNDTSTLTHPPVLSLGAAPLPTLIITADSVSIATGASINVNDRGFIFQQTSNGAGGATTVNGASGNTGGSHAGNSGTGSTGASNPIYGSLVAPTEPGAGAGETISGSSSGGGYVKITVTNNGSFTHNGTITASATLSVSGAASGAGGGVYILTSGVLAGSGSIISDGGGVNNTLRGAGGGGRIAFYYDSSAASDPFTLFTFRSAGGTNVNADANSDHGAAGTIYIEDDAAVGGDTNGLGRIYISNNVISTRTTDFASGLTLGDMFISGATSNVLFGNNVTLNDLTISDSSTMNAQTITMDSFIMNDTASLTHPYTTSLTTYRLDLTADLVTIAASAVVNVDSRGFLSGYTASALGDPTVVGAASGNYGGSHGGQSGVGLSGASNVVYGSIAQPATPGAGAGETSSNSGAGGGYAKITVNNNGTFTHNGIITANSANLTSGFTTGAGGGIYIITTGPLVGTGIIRVNSGTTNNLNRGVGAGGRIAFHYDGTEASDPSSLYTFQAFGADNTNTVDSSRNGSAGTIYIEDTVNSAGIGDLVINNNSLAATTTTPLFISTGPTSYTIKNLSVINLGRLSLDQPPCNTGEVLTVSGVRDFSGGGLVIDNSSGNCTASFAPFVIDTTSLLAGVIGQAYSQTLQASGGQVPYGSWTISVGSLPTGLTLTGATGVISGTPSGPAGTTNFTVQILDGASTTKTQALSISVGNTPDAPSTLYADSADASLGSASPVSALDGLPAFSAIFTDTDGGDSTSYQIEVDDTDNTFASIVWDSTKQPITCTSGNRCSNIAYGGTALTLDGSTYYWRIKYWDAIDIPSAWSTVAQFTTDQAPISPTTLYSNEGTAQTGLANPVGVMSDRPVFSAIYNDPDGSDTANKYQVEVATDANMTSIMWDSGASGTSMASCTQGNRCADVVYNATNALDLDGTQYFWRIKYWDIAGVSSPWSENAPVTNTFTMGFGGSIAISQQQNDQQLTEEQQQAEANAAPATPGLGAVEVLGPDHIRYNWIDQSTNEDGFRLLDGSDSLVIEIAVVDSTSTTESSLPNNTQTDIRRISAYNGNGQSASSADYPQVITAMPLTTPTLSSKDDTSVTFGINQSLNNLEVGESGIEFELLLPETSLTVAALISSGWQQSTSYTFSGIDLVNGGDVRTRARNQVGLITDWSQYYSIASLQGPEPIVEPIPEPEPLAEEVEEAPGDETPPPPPEPITEEESSNIENILEVIIEDEFDTTSRDDDQTEFEQPTEVGIETTSSTDGRSFTLEVSDEVLDTELVVTGLASTDQDRIEFTGGTSQPYSTVTLIFNDNVTILVTSDENGFWQTFVSAAQLGLEPGQTASVKIEAIAAKGNLVSDKVSVGVVELFVGSEDIQAEFDTTVSAIEIVTALKEIQQEVKQVIIEQEEEIQTTLTVVAPVVIVSSAPLWGYLPYLPTLIYHFITYLLGLIGRKKQKQDRLFGIVYDSITKEPLGLAIIRVTKIEDGKSKLVSTKVTDKQGRYDFLLEPGEYKLEVKKPGFTFPSAIITANIDGEFDHVYQGTVHMTKESSTTPDVPLDPENAEKNFDIANIFKKTWMTFQKIGHYLAIPILFVGAIASVLVVIAIPDSLQNWIIAIIYVFLFILQLSLRPKMSKAWGVVYDVATNAVLPLTTIQLIDPEFGKIVKSRLSDYQGRFNFMPDPGKYVVKASKEGYTQTEVVEGQKDRKPIKGEVDISKQDQAITGDIAMTNL